MEVIVTETLVCDAGWTLVGALCYPHPMIMSLLGVIIGAILTGVGQFILDNRKVKLETKSKRILDMEAKRKEYEREAIEATLKWINPLWDGIDNLMILGKKVFVDQEPMEGYWKQEWISQWKEELDTLKLQPHLRSFLPERTEWDRDRVINRIIGLAENKIEFIKELGPDRYYEITIKMASTLSDLYSNLCDAHKATLE